MATPSTPGGRSSSLIKPTANQRLVGALLAFIDLFAIVGLIVVLGLFVDFLAHEGKLPHLADLPIAEQKTVLSDFSSLDGETRKALVEGAGLSPLEGDSNESRRRNALIARLTGKESAPLPAQISAVELQHWAKQNGSMNDPYWSALVENELRWQMLLRAKLRDRVSPEAAECIRVLDSSEGQPVSTSPIGPLVQNGYLSLVARNIHHWTFPILAFAAKLMPWLATPDEAGANGKYLWTLFGLGLFFSVLRFGASQLINRHAARQTLDGVIALRRAIYHHCHRLGNLSLDGDGTAGASSLFLRQVGTVQDELFIRNSVSFRYWVQLAALPILALAANFYLTAAALTIGIVGWLFLHIRLRWLRKQGKESSRRAKGWLARLIESLSIMRLVRSYSMQKFNQARVERQLANYERQERNHYLYEWGARPTIFLFLSSLTILVLFLAALMLMHQPIGAFSLTVVLASLLGLYAPVRSLLARRKFEKKAEIAEDEIQGYLDRQSKIREAIDGEFLDVVRKQIRFEDVTLADQEGRTVLRHLELSIPAGSKIGIVGADDIQKRSLLYLLLRLNDPKSGSVRIDGKDLKWVSKDSLRMQVGVVLQDKLAFNDTVANNIGCGDETIALPQIIEAAKLAHAHQFIQKLPHGYETVIGEFGHSLSLGELYRIALARCILRDPSLLLIEEPSNHLDDETKELLDDTVERFFRGRTVIYIPHRISTLKSCDILHLIHDGRVEVSAKHRDLLHESPLYKHLYYLEFNQFSDGA